MIIHQEVFSRSSIAAKKNLDRMDRMDRMESKKTKHHSRIQIFVGRTAKNVAWPKETEMGLNEPSAGGIDTLSTAKATLSFQIGDLHGETVATGSSTQPQDGVSALFQLENSQTTGELRDALANLVEWLQKPGREALARAFLAWLQRVLLPRKAPGVVLTEVNDLQEANAMLAERVKEWDRQGWVGGRESGIQEGESRGRRDVLVRLLEQKFGPLSEDVRQRIGEADGGTLLVWADRVLTAGSLEELLR